MEKRRKNHARVPQDENNVPFRARLPLKLNDFVSARQGVAKERGCIYEMSLLVACLAENEYENSKCVKEAKMLSSCYENYRVKTASNKIMQEKEVPVPYSKNLTYKQVNTVLKLFRLK